MGQERDPPTGSPTSWDWVTTPTSNLPRGGPTSWLWSTYIAGDVVQVGTPLSWDWNTVSLTTTSTSTSTSTSTTSTSTSTTHTTTAAPTTTSTTKTTTAAPTTTTSPPVTHTETRYMTSFMELSTSQSSSSDYIRKTYAGTDDMVFWAIRVYRWDGSTETEITSTERAIVSRSVDGSGIQSATWSMSDFGMTSPTDSVRVKLRVTKGAGSYETVATWDSGALGASKLCANTWTVYYWTQRTYSAPDTIGDFWYGSASYNSRIEGFKWEEA